MNARLRQVLERLQSGTLSSDDLNALREALRTGHLRIVTGERAVAIGGSTDGAVIVTGDNNIIVRLDAHRRAHLERLLAAPIHNVPPLPDHYIPREEFLA
ncbi:MAG: hypothetical protein D6802_11425, partial [Ardenticatenia bacterium]